MYPPPFDYARPDDLAGALALLADGGDGARVLAGGVGLLPLLKLRQVRPSLLVDIQDLAELRGEPAADGAVSIPALCTHAALTASPAVPPSLRALTEAAAAVGDLQVRNRGTLGGALAEANPSGDWPATLLALRARARCVSAAGEREVEVDDLLLEARAGLRPGELVQAVLVDVPPQGSGSAHVKLERRAGVGVVCVAASVTVDGDGTCRAASVGLTGVAPSAVRAVDAEQRLVGSSLDEALVTEAAAAAGALAGGVDDVRGSVDYRRSVATALCRRALRAARDRAAASQGGDGA